MPHWTSESTTRAGTDDRPALPVRCLRCEATLTTPIVCQHCHSLFPRPHSTNHFDLLGVPQRFELDEGELGTAFRAIARCVHPDRFATEAEPIRALATRLSAEVNEAYQVLSDPVRRASYLTELRGGPTAAECREVPGELLAEVMTLREELGVAKSAGDRAAIERRRNDVRARRAATLARIGALVERLPGSTPDEGVALRRLLNSMKYFDNLLSELAVDPFEGPGHA